MKTPPVLKIRACALMYCCLALLCLSLAACSSHSHFAHRGGVDLNDLPDDEEMAASEPEETANEELAALKGLSSRQKMTLAQAGIDARKYDFPIVLNDQVQYYLDLFQGKQRKYYEHWLARSGAYLPYIEAELQKAGLPKDLAMLAMIESGYNPSAYSPANACGLWQFIAGTGQTYGLKINSWVDERREPTKATKAAISYLSKLHDQFGDWYLAVAAYNTGEKRIADAIDTYDTKDFWTLANTQSLYQETKRYVPKLIAAIIIARDPEHYGFTNINYHAPKDYEKISVPGGVSLKTIASVANTSSEELRQLNNELRKNVTPPNNMYTLKVPVGCKGLLASNMDQLKPTPPPQHPVYAFATHTVKRGDTVGSICSRYKISMTTLLKANNLRSRHLKAGQHLQIPVASASKYAAMQKDAQYGKMASNTVQQTLHHRVGAKDTLASVAHHYHVSVQDLIRWNNLSKRSSLKRGQSLAVYVTKAEKPAAVVAIRHDEKKTPASKKAVVVAVAEKSTKRSNVSAKKVVASAPVKLTGQGKSSKKQVAALAKQFQAPTWYVVKNGDTLTTIARRFNTSAQDLRKWNKLGASSLHQGNKILVKKI